MSKLPVEIPVLSKDAKKKEADKPEDGDAKGASDKPAQDGKDGEDLVSVLPIGVALIQSLILV
jgi:hypothetical protein